MEDTQTRGETHYCVPRVPEHRNTVLAYLLMFRPQQWTKNLLVLIPLLFSRQLLIQGQLLRALAMFAAFCLVSSAVYVVNDLIDRESDRAHPRKRHRAIASGRVGSRAASVAALVLLLAGAVLIRNAAPLAAACLIGYLALQAVYVTVLRHVVILDVMAIAAGFVLRAAAGAHAINVMISPWLLICTILLALFLALIKRRSELIASNQPATHRRVLSDYSQPLLDQLIAVVTSGTILAYMLYTYSSETTRRFDTRLMPLTLPFVLYGIFRYLYLTYTRSQGAEPEVLFLTDLPLLVTIFLWCGAVAAIVYQGVVQP